MTGAHVLCAQQGHAREVVTFPLDVKTASADVRLAQFILDTLGHRWTLKIGERVVIELDLCRRCQRIFDKVQVCVEKEFR